MNFLKSIFHKISGYGFPESKGDHKIDFSKFKVNRFGSLNVDDLVEYVSDENGTNAYLDLSLLSKALVYHLKYKSDFAYIRETDIRYNILYSYEAPYIHVNDPVIEIMIECYIAGQNLHPTTIVIHCKKEGYLFSSNEIGEKTNEKILLFSIKSQYIDKDGKVYDFEKVPGYTFSLYLDHIEPGLYSALCDVYPVPSKPVTLKWISKTGEFVDLDEIICKIETPLGSFDLHSRKRGFLRINTYDIPSTFDKTSGYNFDPEPIYDNVYTIFKDEESVIYDMDSEVDLIKDEFTGEYKSYWKRFCGKDLEDENLNADAFYEMDSNDNKRIFISLQYINDKILLVIGANSKELKLSIGDHLLLLLQDPIDNKKTICSFLLSEECRINNRNTFDIALSTEITNDDLLHLAYCKCIKWRLMPKSLYYTILEGTNENSWISEKISGDVLQKAFNEFRDSLELNGLINDSAFLDSTTQETSASLDETDKCFVYLMVDTTNGFYKIGMSKDPQYRESTLQSEKPTIELVCAKEFPNRQIASSIESALHKTYSEKNIRGEWFALTKQEVEALRATLS